MKLSLLPVHGGPFNNMPANEVELKDEDIYCNDVILPGEFNPNKVRLFVISHQFGPIAAVWSAEHELLDTACDLGLMDGFSSEDEHKEHEAIHTAECMENCPHDSCECALLGNASEPFNIDDCFIQRVDLEPSKHWKLLVAFAEARGAGRDTLWS